MEKYVVTGGAVLKGEVTISGRKECGGGDHSGYCSGTGCLCH